MESAIKYKIVEYWEKKTLKWWKTYTVHSWTCWLGRIVGKITILRDINERKSNLLKLFAGRQGNKGLDNISAKCYTFCRVTYWTIFSDKYSKKNSNYDPFYAFVSGFTVFLNQTHCDSFHSLGNETCQNVVEAARSSRKTLKYGWLEIVYCRLGTEKSDVTDEMFAVNR